MNIDGIINIYKEKGYTSFDVVAKLRGILGMKRIGHTGTLDPDATGVLIVCLGKACKLVDMITASDKSYITTMELGITTDTYDTSGKILTRNTEIPLTEEVEKVIKEYIKPYDQIPPMYSAIKINGKKLYELARAGKEVERKSRKITINNIKNINKIDDIHYKFEVNCSKGTYIRSLVFDIGNTLGCGAAMSELVRNRVGSVDLDMCYKLEDVEEYMQKGKILDIIAPIEDVLIEYPTFMLSKEYMKEIINGSKLPLEIIPNKENLDLEKIGKILVKDFKGTPVGIYKLETKDGVTCYRVDKYLYPKIN